MTGGEPEPAGFPRCKACALFSTAAAAQCLDCIRRTSGYPRDGRSCTICGQVLDSGTCINVLCHDADRQFEQAFSVGWMRGQLYDKIADDFKGAFANVDFVVTPTSPTVGSWRMR